MPTDFITLGPFEFDAWSAPEKLPFGGRQQVSVKKLPGGSRVVDCMGPDDIDRAWTAKLWGDSAASDALTLDQLRRSGEPLPYSNGFESRTVIILEFLPLAVKVQYIEFSIILLPVDASSGGGGFGGGLGLSSLDSLVGSDLAAAASLIPPISVDVTLPGLSVGVSF